MITFKLYKNSFYTLFEFPFENTIYALHRLAANYTFNSAHSTMRSVDASALVGEPIKLTGKTITVEGDVTYLSCNNAEIGTIALDAQSAVIATMPESRIATSDRLLCFLDLDNGNVVHMNTALQFSDCGLIALKRP